MSEDERPAGWSDDERVRRWIAGAAQRESQMIPVTEELFEAAALREGETVLDVGVGTGPTTLRAAALVGPGARVVGVDVAPAMIEVARAAVARDPDAPQLEWLVADAQTYDFGEGVFDAIISRFGVMFFPDPVAAFANLARATRPGGRLVIAVWQTRDKVPLFDLPYRAAVQVLQQRGRDYEPIAEDALQCSLGTPDVVASVLEPAGWHQVEARPTAESLHVGGGLTAEQAAQESLDIGATRTLLEGQPENVRDEVAAALTSAFEPLFDGHGVSVPAGFMIVTARR